MRRALWVCVAVALLGAVNSPWVRRPPQPTRQEMADFVAGGVVWGMVALLVVPGLPVVGTVVLCRLVPSLKWAEAVMQLWGRSCCAGWCPA
ncbi:hypothetical protein [Kitasatospora sp. NPDC059599]|uniref:hypothetical protein n=1 Tax=Kitasatospora sp. NPDC059599 TaxID=3346880 RepID=UPI0036A3E03B